MARARGANATLAGAFETTYGTPPGSGYKKLPFVSSALGEERGLLASDLLGYGREGLPPSQDVATNDGDIVVPVDSEALGVWLKLMFGDPVTAGDDASTGHYDFSAQPADGTSFNINGVAWTFRASGATGAESNIGVSLAATLTALATALNASSNAALTPATYTATSTRLNIAYDTPGTGGNAYTLGIPQPNVHAVRSGATLTGGTNSHTFISGATALPSMSIEVGLPEVPSFGMNFGVRGGMLKIGMAKSGQLNATVSLVAQGETIASSTAAGTPAEIGAAGVQRFPQAIGEITRNSAVLASVVSADVNYSNNLDKVETIRRDGRIEDADPGLVSVSGNVVTRFADTVLLDQATSGDPCELTFGWAFDTGPSLLITVHSVYLPPAKRPVTGPGGVQTTFAWQGAPDLTLGKSVTAVLTNTVAGY